MRDPTETRYYQRRESQARSLSEAASDPNIRAIHREMADRYAQLVVGRDRNAQ